MVSTLIQNARDYHKRHAIYKLYLLTFMYIYVYIYVHILIIIEDGMFGVVLLRLCDSLKKTKSNNQLILEKNYTFTKRNFMTHTEVYCGVSLWWESDNRPCQIS